jgi:hypothetical protein
VTTSPLQNRGQFGSFGQQTNGGFSFGFSSQSSPQRQNPYLDTTGFGEVIIILFLRVRALRLAQFFLSVKPHNALIIFSVILRHGKG